MTEVYVKFDPEIAKDLYEKCPDVKFLWRLVPYETFTEDNIFRISYEHFPKAHQNKFVQLTIRSHIHDHSDKIEYELRSTLSEDQSDLELLGFNKPRAKRKT